MSDGWKYFNLKNLNELFSIKYDELVKSGEIDEKDLLSKVSKSLKGNLSMSLAEEEILVALDKNSEYAQTNSARFTKAAIHKKFRDKNSSAIDL